MYRSLDPEAQAPRPAARLQGAGGPLRFDRRRPDLLRHDLWPRLDELGAVDRLDGDRPGDLLPVRTKAQQSASVAAKRWKVGVGRWSSVVGRWPMLGLMLVRRSDVSFAATFRDGPT